ncbi:MAG: YbaB/EbfC family nucleoid-associated protein [Fimbriimonadales bacterium]|nr:YbaB/EbfC family nucleoid-associated protein [Fimbriimonadales bacterium]
MKLPKGFGDFGSMLNQIRDALARAEELNQELKLMEVDVEKNGVRVKYNGAGEILSLSLDPDLVANSDVASLEDAILLALREGHQKSVQLREQKVKEMTGGLGLPPGLGGL